MKNSQEVLGEMRGLMQKRKGDPQDVCVLRCSEKMLLLKRAALLFHCCGSPQYFEPPTPTGYLTCSLSRRLSDWHLRGVQL